MAITLFVGTVKGAFLVTSNDNRTDWNVGEPFFPGWKVTTATRTENGDYLAATASDWFGPALHRSTDLTNWEQIVDGPSWPEGSERKLNQVWFIDARRKPWFAGVDEAGLFRSNDDGTTWRPVDGLNEHPTRSQWHPGAGGLCAHAFLRDQNDPDRFWCGISAVGVFRSDDGGSTWNPFNRGVKVIIPAEKTPEIGYCVHALAQDPDNPDTIWQQNHVGMYRTRDGGESWESIQTGLPSTFGFPLEIDPHTRSLYSFPLHSDQKRLPVDGACRVYRSTDEGASWEALDNGLPDDGFYGGVLRGAMDVDGLDPCGIYFGTTSGTLHASSDRGDSWMTIPGTLPRILTVRVLEA